MAVVVDEPVIDTLRGMGGGFPSSRLTIMGNTTKKILRSPYRKPKGRVNAIRNKARKKAIPPDAWDDISHDPLCFTPAYNACKRMLKKGWDEDTILHRLVNKFNLSFAEARSILELFTRYKYKHNQHWWNREKWEDI